jgi:Flp pilus assembly protein TadG
MMRRAAARLARDRRGAETIEFALTALILLVIVMGMLELGTMAWVWQALQSTAWDAARCAGISASACANVTTAPSSTASYAVSSAQTRGLAITTSNVTVSTGTSAQAACGYSNMVQVAVTFPFGTVFLVPLPTSVTGSACYPLPISG